MKCSDFNQPTLLIEAAPKVLFLFGLPGAGKTYIGDLIARYSNYFHYNADSEFTPSMLRAIQQKEEFSDAMRDEYYGLIAKRLPELVLEYGRVIVSQAAFRKRHRQTVKEGWEDMEYIWVKAPEKLLVERLVLRGDEVTPEYLKRVAPNFEEPEGSSRVLINDSDNEKILQYFETWYS